MSENNRNGADKKKRKDALRKAARIGRIGARGVGAVISLILKIIGTILLVLVTAGAIFACIFLVYIKTNLSQVQDLTLEEMKLTLSSVVYAQDNATGEWEEIAVLQSDKTAFELCALMASAGLPGTPREA